MTDCQRLKLKCIRQYTFVVFKYIYLYTDVLMVLSMIISFLCLTNVETSIVSISDICGMQETSSNQILNAEESVVLYFWGQKDKRGKLWG